MRQVNVNGKGAVFQVSDTKWVARSALEWMTAESPSSNNFRVRQKLSPRRNSVISKRAQTTPKNIFRVRIP